MIFSLTISDSAMVSFHLNEYLGLGAFDLTSVKSVDGSWSKVAFGATLVRITLFDL